MTSKKLLFLLYPLLRLSKVICRQLKYGSSGSLRVLTYHHINENDFHNFKKQIIWLSKNWQFITPKKFKELVSKGIELKGDYLLITFDDGFKSNINIAKNILDPLGIKAIFFIVSDFMKITSVEDSYKFSRNNLLFSPCRSQGELNPVNMDLEDLKSLVLNGHTIGAHTKTHPNIAKLNQHDLKIELVDSTVFLENELRVEIQDFAYTFGDIKRFSEMGLKMAVSKFQYVYSGLRGDNTGLNDTYSIRRDAINASDSPWLIGSILLGLFDFKYKKSINILETWVKNCKN